MGFQKTAIKCFAPTATKEKNGIVVALILKGLNHAIDTTFHP